MSQFVFVIFIDNLTFGRRVALKFFEQVIFCLQDINIPFVNHLLKLFPR